MHPYGRVVLLLALAAGAALAEQQSGSAFTYQGRLNDAGNTASGAYDLRFTLYDAAEKGSTVGAGVDLEDVEVKNGLFTVELDFGMRAFDGKARFLEVAVRPAKSEEQYTTLQPRQPLTAAPYALYALNAPSGGSSGSPAPEPRTGAHWAETWTGIGTGLTLESFLGTGLQGQTDGTWGAGVYGLATSTQASDGAVPGVHGVTQSLGPDPNTVQFYYPAGVLGEATASTGRTIGVYGLSGSSNGFGVAGWSYQSFPNAVNYGVWGSSVSPLGEGVHGLGESVVGANIGVSGETRSTEGIGVK